MASEYSLPDQIETDSMPDTKHYRQIRRAIWRNSMVNLPRHELGETPGTGTSKRVWGNIDDRAVNVRAVLVYRAGRAHDDARHP